MLLNLNKMEAKKDGTTFQHSKMDDRCNASFQGIKKYTALIIH